MTITMRVISYQIHDIPDSDPPKKMYQVKLYGVHQEHGVLVEMAQPDNDLGFLPDRSYVMTLEEQAN